MTTRRRALPELSPEQIQTLRELARYRTVTCAQAQVLFRHFRDASSRANYKKLERLADRGLVNLHPILPEKGRFSAVYYALTAKAVDLLNKLAAPGTKTLSRPLLVRRPPQHLLNYFLFRNTVYAEALAAGWLVASPRLFPADRHPQMLKVFNGWVLDTMTKLVRDLQLAGAPPMDLARLVEEAGRKDAELPKALTFEYLVRMADKQASDVVLLIVDDPRRSVARQAAELPPRLLLPPAGKRSFSRAGQAVAVACPGLRVLLRDAESIYDMKTSSVARATPRLREWHRHLVDRYRDEILLTDTLFPSLWARRINEPVAAPAVPSISKEPTSP